MKQTLPIGCSVKHTVPSMLFHQKGTIVEFAGTRYGNKYFWVSYVNPTTKKAYKTAFWDQVLKIAK